MKKNEIEHLDWMRSVDERDIMNITKQIVDNTSEKDIEITYGWDKTAYTFKTITEWKVGYIFYDKVPSISKIIKEITKRRKKEKEVNQWAVVLPKAYAKKYSKQLNALNIHTIEEKKHKEISTLTGGKLHQPNKKTAFCCICKKKIMGRIMNNRINERFCEKCFRNYYKKYVPMDELNL